MNQLASFVCSSRTDVTCPVQQNQSGAKVVPRKDYMAKLGCLEWNSLMYDGWSSGHRAYALLSHCAAAEMADASSHAYCKLTTLSRTMPVSSCVSEDSHVDVDKQFQHTLLVLLVLLVLLTLDPVDSGLKASLLGVERLGEGSLPLTNSSVAPAQVVGPEVPSWSFSSK